MSTYLSKYLTIIKVEISLKKDLFLILYRKHLD